MSRDESEYRIEDPQQIAELVSPVRMEILDAMSSLAPCSIAELAEELGRPADSLYYHVRKLVKCGLLLDAGAREKGGRTETLFGVHAKRMRVAHDHRDEERMQLIADASSAMLRQADRNLRTELLSGNDTGDGLRRHTGAGRNRAWLTPREIEQVNRLVARIANIYMGAERRKSATLHSFSFAMSPIPTGRRRRGGDEEEDGGEERPGELQPTPREEEAGRKDPSLA